MNAAGDVWNKVRRKAGEACGFILELLRDVIGRMLFGIMLAMIGASIPSALLTGFGLGVVFSTALDLYWQRRAKP